MISVQFCSVLCQFLPWIHSHMDVSGLISCVFYLGDDCTTYHEEFQDQLTWFNMISQLIHSNCGFLLTFWLFYKWLVSERMPLSITKSMTLLANEYFLYNVTGLSQLVAFYFGTAKFNQDNSCKQTSRQEERLYFRNTINLICLAIIWIIHVLWYEREVISHDVYYS